MVVAGNFLHASYGGLTKFYEGFIPDIQEPGGRLRPIFLVMDPPVSLSGLHGLGFLMVSHRGVCFKLIVFGR